MDQTRDLALILKTYPFSERDLVAVLFTENHGRITALAKGAVHSRRYGGSLGFLAASRVRFIQKPTAEMCRLDEAVIEHEFAQIGLDFERLTVASFMAEFCLRLLEPYAPSRDLFLVLTNALYRLDEGKAPVLILNAFLCKTLRIFGYPPNLIACAQCSLGVQEIYEKAGLQGINPFYWDQIVGGVVCGTCASTHLQEFRRTIDIRTLVLFHDMMAQSFKELQFDALAPHGELYRILINFLHHHVPGLEKGGGLKSLKILDETMMAAHQ